MKKKITTTLNVILIEWIELYIKDMSQKGVSLKKTDVIEKALIEFRDSKGN